MIPKNIVSPCLLLSAALLTPALAVPVQLTMTGTITSSNMTAFAYGQTTTVSLTYETSSSYQSLMTQQAFYVNPMSSVSVTSGAYSGSDTTGPFGLINLYNNLPVWWQSDPYDGVSFLVANNPGHYTFSSGANTVTMPSVFSNNTTQTFELLRVNLEANYSTVWDTWALPELIEFADFNVNRTMNFGFSGGSFTAGITSIQFEQIGPPSVPSGPSVPDSAATAALLATGLLCLGAARRRVAA